MTKLEMEQAAEREDFERKVSKIALLSPTVPHISCDVFLLNSTINIDKIERKNRGLCIAEVINKCSLIEFI